ncbi:uncharacterized protein NEMAJ01_2025 [Nematocida major]|uniref:uncharacterized protein n=1 Tax=Nematocida major TaxID=1912982 RepID=UPI0020089466|nr:uncharacterized protein NEMAJ01_2025 [Nematocida major]KAH9387129.1 hypothetical protein NEMAJ01_2025 [Nematocida major]
MGFWQTLRASWKGQALLRVGVLLVMLCAARGSMFMRKRADKEACTERRIQSMNREGSSREESRRSECSSREAGREDARLTAALKEQAESFKAYVAQRMERVEEAIKKLERSLNAKSPQNIGKVEELQNYIAKLEKSRAQDAVQMEEYKKNFKDGGGHTGSRRVLG